MRNERLLQTTADVRSPAFAKLLQSTTASFSNAIAAAEHTCLAFSDNVVDGANLDLPQDTPQLKVGIVARCSVEQCPDFTAAKDSYASQSCAKPLAQPSRSMASTSTSKPWRFSPKIRFPMRAAHTPNFFRLLLPTRPSQTLPKRKRSSKEGAAVRFAIQP